MSTTALSLMLIVAIVVSMAKPILELGLKPNTAIHDTGIRIIAILVGIAGAMVDYAIHTHNWWNGPGVETALGIGLAAGVGAMATFHLLTSDVWSTLTPGQSTVITTGSGGSATIASIPPGSSPNVMPMQTLVPATIQKAEIVTPDPPASTDHHPPPPVVGS